VNPTVIKIKSLWEKLMGRPSEYPMEARVFHAVCIILIATLGCNIAFNYLIDIPALSFLMLFVYISVIVLYYYSRVKRRHALSIPLFGVLINVFFIFNFYLDSGSMGPSLLTFILAIFLMLAIAPPWQYKIWLPLNIVLVFSLLFIDYIRPEWIEYSYINSKSRFIDYNYSYMVTAGVLAWVIIFIRKSYERERASAEKRARELESIDRTKNKLFSIVAHDLKSPLGSIYNYLQILSEVQIAEEERQTLQRELFHQTRNTIQLLSNLLSWTKGQMDGVNVNLVPLRLDAALQSTVEIQQMLAAEKQINLENGLRNIFIVADADMLQLVFRNLLNNAVKFSVRGGKIGITSEMEGDHCIICVRDNGIGIPASQHSEVFNIKSRSTFGTDNEKGVGLGLMLCKEFTELQNGRIWFESAEGTGTAFFVQMKLAPSGYS